MWGIVLVALAALIAISATLRDNRAKPPAKSLLFGLNPYGVLLLFLTVVALVVGVGKEVADERARSNDKTAISGLQTSLDEADLQRSTLNEKLKQAEKQQSEVQARLGEAHTMITRLQKASTWAGQANAVLAAFKENLSIAKARAEMMMTSSSVLWVAKPNSELPEALLRFNDLYRTGDSLEEKWKAAKRSLKAHEANLEAARSALEEADRRLAPLTSHCKPPKLIPPSEFRVDPSGGTRHGGLQPRVRFVSPRIRPAESITQWNEFLLKFEESALRALETVIQARRLDTGP